MTRVAAKIKDISPAFPLQAGQFRQIYQLMREIIFDTETTGLDPKSGDRLVEIGCIEMVNRVATGHTFHAYFNPQRTMPAAAQAVHGLSDSFLSDKPLFAVKADDLLNFLGDDAPLVAHNANFDFGFLNSELAQIGRDPISLSRMIDTVALARVRHPGAKLSLDALCTRYGIDRSHRTQHGALLDAELLAQVYVELTGGRQIGLELAADTMGAGLIAATSAPLHRGRPFRRPRPHSASPEELAAHAEFLTKIKDPVWTS
ncbi:MAG: polymerase subunit epsilon [Pseudomonadota bacterium]